jgi:LPXTG-site transpeptidase (sortase) family protein
VGAGWVFTTTLVHALWYAPEEDASVAVPPTASLGTTSPIVLTSARDIPVELSIPAINVDAHVQDVGIGKTGNMAVPTNYTDVGWYRYGTVPGAVGSAVIDGHVDNGFGLDAVFKHISELKPGDDIYVQTQSGEELHFVVQDIETYPATQVPLQTLFTRDDEPRLNLITCAGQWEPDKEAYDHRTVVYAVLAE